VAADGTESYPSREDRIVAEFGDGFDVEGIGLRYGLTVAQVYAVIEREVGPAGHPPPPPATHYYAPPPVQGHGGPPAYQVQQPSPEQYAPPAAYAPPTHAAQKPGPPLPHSFLDDDAIVAEYGEGHDVKWIARKHGIDVNRVYHVVQRILQDDPQPPTGPTSF
jgi:Mor family transcriptional regulator